MCGGRLTWTEYVIWLPGPLERWKAAMFCPSWPPPPRSVTVTELGTPGASGIEPGVTVSQLASEAAVTHFSTKQFSIRTVTVLLVVLRRSTVPGETTTIRQ